MLEKACHYATHVITPRLTLVVLTEYRASYDSGQSNEGKTAWCSKHPTTKGEELSFVLGTFCSAFDMKQRQDYVSVESIVLGTHNFFEMYKMEASAQARKDDRTTNSDGRTGELRLHYCWWRPGRLHCCVQTSRRQLISIDFDHRGWSRSHWTPIDWLWSGMFCSSQVGPRLELRHYSSVPSQ